ncbi:Zn-dependent protease with chaperone function [Enterobacter sp. AG5470]|nr:Zn-dependent protease with chaperone function [Enterobacter sp. AG5470]
MDKKSLLYCFGIPLLLFIWSCWQYSRISDSDAWVVIEWGTVSHNILMPLSRRYVAGVSVTLSVIALFASTCAVVLSLYSVRKARISTGQLIHAFTLCRKMLPLIMAALMTAMGFALVSVLLYEFLWLLTIKQTTPLNIKLFGVLLLVIGWLIFMVLSSLFLLKRCYAKIQPQDRNVFGIAMTEQDAPALWRWVRELAQRGQAIMPDNIVVGLFQGFYVTTLPVQLEKGERLTGNTLYFPVTLAAFLDKDEIAAVIGHELGHFSGQDTAYTLHFAGLYSGMKSSLDHFYQNLKFCGWFERIALSPPVHIGVWFYRRFDVTVSGWSRMRELAADAAGARTSTPQALASSLLRCTTLDIELAAPMQRFLDRKLSTTNLVNTLYSGLYKLGALNAEVALGRKLSHPTDHHPTVRERLKQLNVPPDNVLLTRASRQVNEADYLWLQHLLPDFPALCRALTAQVNDELNANHHAYLEQLQEMVAQASDAVVVSLKKGNVWGYIALAMIAGFPACVLFILNRLWGLTFLQFDTVVGGLAAMSIILALGAWAMYQRVRQPLLTLRPQAIESYQLSAPLALSKIEATHVSKFRGQNCIELYWTEGYQPPECIVGRFVHNFIFDTQKRKVIITIPGGMTQGEARENITLGELHTRIREYIGATWARQTLNDL